MPEFGTSALQSAPSDAKSKQFIEFVLIPYKRKDEKDPKSQWVQSPAETATCFRAWAEESDLGFNMSGLWLDLRNSFEKDIKIVRDAQASAESGVEVMVPVAVFEREDYCDMDKTKRSKALIQKAEEHLVTKWEDRSGMLCRDKDGVGHPITADTVDMIESVLMKQANNPDLSRTGRPKGGGFCFFEPVTRQKELQKIRSFVGRPVRFEWRGADPSVLKVAQ